MVGGDHLVVSADDGVFTFTNVAAVPEPQTYALMLAGVGLIGAIARRRRAAGIRIVTCCRPRRPVEAAGF